jgi:hypothetical protein
MVYTPEFTGRIAAITAKADMADYQASVPKSNDRARKCWPEGLSSSIFLKCVPPTLAHHQR